MVTQVIGRVSGTGITTIWSDSKEDILNKNKYYAEMKPFTREETAFLYSFKNHFIAVSNQFSQTETESRSHAVNYFTYMDQTEMKQFQSYVPIDFEKARKLGDESVAEKCGTEGFLTEKLERENSKFSEQEKKLILEVMCHVVNGVPVNISCEKKKEVSLFTSFIQLFSKKEIGLNVNLGTNIDISINGKIGDCMDLELKSSRSRVDIPEEISKVLGNLEETIVFWNKVKTLTEGKEVTDTKLVQFAKERLEEKEWESLGIPKMTWPIDRPTEEDAFSMQETLMNLYFSCEELKEKEEKFCRLQKLYQRELSKMIEVQAVKPSQDKIYLALVLIVCFKISPYQCYLKQKNANQYFPICLSEREVEQFFEDNHINKWISRSIWSEMKKIITTFAIGE